MRVSEKREGLNDPINAFFAAEESEEKVEAKTEAKPEAKRARAEPAKETGEWVLPTLSLCLFHFSLIFL